VTVRAGRDGQGFAASTPREQAPSIADQVARISRHLVENSRF